jgi:hypothetical protein
MEKEISTTADETRYNEPDQHEGFFARHKVKIVKLLVVALIVGTFTMGAISCLMQWVFWMARPLGCQKAEYGVM